MNVHIYIHVHIFACTMYRYTQVCCFYIHIHMYITHLESHNAHFCLVILSINLPRPKEALKLQEEWERTVGRL